MMTKIGIIGGTGLENPELIKNAEEKEIVTPYGRCSDRLITGTIGDKEVVLLSRHGRKHTIPPTQVNNRANIYALHKEGCNYVIATTACGSLREFIDRGHFVVPDQFIDFTRHRILTFFEQFEEGNMKHTPMANPFDEALRQAIIQSAENLSFPVHKKGTVVTIEGPRFSTRAESNMFRLWGGDIINMSTAPEAILANEIGLPYAAIALSTDFDCWKIEEKPVTWEEVVKTFQENVNRMIGLLLDVIAKL